MLFVITGQIASRGGLIGNRGIERWLGHNQARLYLPTPTRLLPTQSSTERKVPRTGIIIIKCMIRQDDIYQDHLPHVFHCLNRRSAILAFAQMRISTKPQPHGGNRGWSIVEHTPW
jgi:hypothetical protein